MFGSATEGLTHLIQIIAGASKLTYASIGVGLLVAVLYFKLFFKDAAGFREDSEKAAKGYWYSKWAFWVRPAEYQEYQWSELKVFVWLAISVGSGILAYYQLPDWFPRAFQ